MLVIVFTSFVLVVLTAGIHFLGLSFLIQYLLKKAKSVKQPGLKRNTWPLIWSAWCLLLLHLVEISVWGLFYYWQGCFVNARSAFYFSGVTYTTVGYGDLVLPEQWRMLAPCEALIGILMVGLSSGLFFAVIHRLLEPYLNERSSLETSQLIDWPSPKLGCQRLAAL
jgi:hypothetical protein